MRIAIVDYSGHAFPVHLSRSLAGRGHEMLHLYFQEFQSPHGKLYKTESDPPELTIKPVSLGIPFPKYSLLKRRRHEIAIGKAFASTIHAFAPDIVLVGNCPLDCAMQISGRAKQLGYGVIFWQQDIYSSAIRRILSKRIGLPGRMIGAYYRNMEQRIVALSDATIVISEDFVDSIRTELAMPVTNVHVIENWAPLEDIPVRPKNNPWAVKHDLCDKKVILYSGTIGLKHNPQQILDLAANLKDEADTQIVVVSEGPFADWLGQNAADQGLSNIRVLPFQPYADFPDVLGSSDLAIAVLEEDAGAFSVPSKILSYLCAGRPIVLSAPTENLAARIIVGCGAGKAVPAADNKAFIAAVRELIVAPDACATAGRNARRYAETTFDIDKITGRFELIFREALAHKGLPARLVRMPVAA
ncbi:MAG: glycosyltransferase family 4 protein, partial [Tardiphaga sp.]